MKDKGITLQQKQDRAAAALANVGETTHGTTVFTGPAVEVARLFAMISALKMEIKGVEVTRHSVSKQVREEFGFRGTKQDLLQQLMLYRFTNYPGHPIDTPCPECGVKALVNVRPEDGLDVSDGTQYLCHPMLKGCNTGFSVDGR